MDEVKYFNHFGVYGVALKGNQLLCIRKNSGPYTGRYDLPGGSQENGEGLTDTLVREVMEETGYKVRYFSHNRIYDTCVYDKLGKAMRYHVFALYDITLSESFEAVPEKVPDGKNDSAGAKWIDLKRLNEFNSSPLILKVIEEIEHGHASLEKSLFENWKILDR